MEKEQLLFRDALTGIYTQDYFFETGGYLVALATRSKSPLSICVIDIDHLSRINERFGNEIGDKVLRTVAKTIETKCRKSDLLGYLDSGTIGLILYDITGINTGVVLNSLRKKIENELEALNVPKLKGTVSIGACIMQGEIDKEKLELAYNRAYMAVKKAKEAGRNRVEVF
ncbi:MAG: GGDEF domain-containing protein [Sulfurovum sp.]|nr:GGDEF domain-containing protein [Sulfurovum sp.]